MAGYLTKRNGTVKITAGSLDYTFDDVGDFSCGAIQEGGRGAAAIIHRGAYKSRIETDDEPIPVSFTATLQREPLTDAADEVILDFIRKTGTAASATTTNPGGTGPMTWTLTYTLVFGATTTVLTVTNVRLMATLDESGPAIVVSVSGEGYGMNCT